MVALSGRGFNIGNLPLRMVALSGRGGGQYRQPSPTRGGAIGEGVNIGILPLRVVVLSGWGSWVNIGNLPPTSGGAIGEGRGSI